MYNVQGTMYNLKLRSKRFLHFTFYILHSSKGLSLVESILVITVILGIIVLIANIPNSISLITKSRHLSIAKEIATKAIEDKRAMEYSSLANGANIPVSDTRVSLLPSGAAAYTVADCTPPVCLDSSNAKTVSVIINWKEGSKLQDFKIDTIIGEGGF